MVCSSVLTEHVILKWKLLWLMTEELTILVWSEDVHIIEFVHETSTIIVDTSFFNVGGIPDNLVSLYHTAGDSWASRPKLPRVPSPRARESEVITMFIHDHGFTKDGRIA